MSKNSFRKFKKNEFYDDEEEQHNDNRSRYLEKKYAKRFERALKTKDISSLVEDDLDIEEDWEHLQDWTR